MTTPMQKIQDKVAAGIITEAQGKYETLYTLAYFNTLKDQRNGQALMNALLKVDSDLYTEITGTPRDCFHQDARIPAFDSYVKETWGLTT